MLDDPAETVTANARGKALAVSGTYAGAEQVVLGSDTVVYLPQRKQTLGQAKSDEDVREMLTLLGGTVHEVHSGVAVVRGEDVEVRHAVTEVRMREIGGDELAAYVAFGEGAGKAGGYAIQGRAGVFVEWIGGDYTNVVGLPLVLTIRLLERFGVRWY